mgnify:CR=1 FL=1
MSVPDKSVPRISIRGLKKAFGPKVVLDGVDLDVAVGESLVIIGGSGTGKSVLLKCILGLIQPDAGSIKLDGQELVGLKGKALEQARARFGMLFQGGALFSGLTVAENIEVPLREYFTLSDQLMDEIAGYKVAMVGLPPEAGPKYPSELSGGMKKRAALARALALDPKLLFLDEPTAGLDPIGAAAFDSLTRTLQQALGLTVFLITHDLDTLYTICDRVAVLADRKVVAVAPVQELEQLDHAWVQEYFNGPRGRAARG